MKQFYYYLSIVILLLFCQILPAQISFIFTPLSGTYTALDPNTATTATGVPTTVTWTTTDEGAYNDIPIGFNFMYIGVIEDSISVSPNGWARFGQNLDPNVVTGGDGWGNNLDNSATYIRPIMAPLWDDYDMEYGNIYYETSGTAPNRVFTCEWDSVEWQWNSNNVAVSFQLKLYETSNRIEFHYLDLPTAPSSSSASIGLTDVGTGANNFLSLSDASASPTVSYTVETDNVVGPPATGQIYRFDPPATDLKAEAITAPNPAGGCYGASETVTVEVLNTGNQPLDFSVDNATLTVNITGPIPASLSETITTGTLAPGAILSHTFASTVSLTTVGTYNFDFSVSMTNDQNAANDALPTLNYVVAPFEALPQNVDFVGYTGANLGSLFTNWSEGNGSPNPAGTTSNWVSAATAQQTAFGFNTARLNLNGTAQNAWLLSPKFVASATDVVSFFSALTEHDLAIADGTGSNAMAGTDDMVQLMISTDCGLSFTNLFTLDGSTGLSEVFAQFNVSLAAYAGQSVIVAFYGTDGPVLNAADYDIHLSDIFIGTPPPHDLAVTAMISPADGLDCYSPTEAVTVEVTNFGTDPVDFSVNNATVTVNVTGAAVQTFNVTLNTGTLVSAGVMNVNMGTLDMSSGGTFMLDASVSLPTDGNNSNDALPTQTRTGKLAVVLPNSVDFTGYTGGNLPAMFAGWAEGNGVNIPTNTFGAWIAASGTQQASFGFNTARVGLFGTNRNEWIISPVFTPTTLDGINFFAATTEFGQPQADGNGSNAMSGTDDRVRVMLTTDCGLTWNSIYTLDQTSGLTENFSYFGIPLGAYTGQQIIVAFYATDGPVDDLPSYDFHLADITLGELLNLPVELLDFTGQQVGTENHLDWITVSEENSAHFIIERIDREGNFQELGHIPAAGHSNQSLSYQFVDIAPFEGINTYRLREVDLNGQELILGNVEVFFETTPQLKVYPNPFNHIIHFELPGVEGQHVLRIYDLSGRLIHTHNQHLHHGETMDISTEDWSVGWYLFRLVSPVGVLQGKLQKE